MGIEIGGIKELVVNEEVVIPPYPIENHLRYNDGVILLLSSWRRSPLSDRSFEIPSEQKNVVAFHKDGTRAWWIESVPDSKSDSYYRKLWQIQDLFLLRHDDYHVEFDPDTGSVLNAWDRSQLPIGDQIVDLSGEPAQIVELDGAVFVASPGSEGNDIQAFDPDGSERWRSSPDEWRGSLYEEDGELWEVVGIDRGKDDHYRLDPDTGTRIESWSNY